MNIAIIGCGYVGTAVAQQWCESGHAIVATTTTRDRIPELDRFARRVAVLKGNDPDALAAVVENQDVIVLCVGAQNANLYRQTYLETAENLVTAIARSSTVKQLIYTSSYAVYGNKNGAWVDEQTPLAPANENGKILEKTEQVLLSANHDRLNVCILRLGGIYGPGRELVKIFSRFAGQTGPGRGDEFSNWIHLDDIVGALEFVRLNCCQGVYNLVNDTPLPLRELLDRLCEHHGLAKVIWDPSTAPVRPYNSRVSNQKLKAAGFQLIHPQTLF